MADADALDFLGATGVLRDFSKTPRDLRKAYEISLKRMIKLPDLLQTDRAKELAVPKVEAMRRILREFEAETKGVF